MGAQAARTSPACSRRRRWPRRPARGGRRGRRVPRVRPRVVRVRRDHPRRRRLVRPTSLNEVPVTTTDFSETDLFRDKVLPRTRTPTTSGCASTVRCGTTRIWDVVHGHRLRGGDRGLQRPRDVLVLQHGERAVRAVFRCRSRATTSARSSSSTATRCRSATSCRRSTRRAHRAPRPADAADHAEAPEGERGVHVAARRRADRRVPRPAASASSSTTTRTRSRCS